MFVTNNNLIISPVSLSTMEVTLYHGSTLTCYYVTGMTHKNFKSDYKKKSVHTQKFKKCSQKKIESVHTQKFKKCSQKKIESVHTQKFKKCLQK